MDDSFELSPEEEVVKIAANTVLNVILVQNMKIVLNDTRKHGTPLNKTNMNMLPFQVNICATNVDRSLKALVDYGLTII